MITIKYGRNKIEGELVGFSPGSNEFEIELAGDVKILFTSKSERQYQIHNSLRVAMNSVGLNKLRDAIVDFNSGAIELGEKPEPVKPIQKRQDISKSSGSGLV